MIGKRVGHYEVTGRLGAGGMGEVYLAHDTRLERKVALKVLPAELAADPERLKRLVREAKALAALDHPHIVTVFSVEEDDGVRFLTMAYVKGESLDALIPEHGLPAERLIEIALPLADALRAAHERGIIHRDLKPSNVMVDGEGRLRVLDFGLAKRDGRVPGDLSESATLAASEQMTREGAVLGTYPYMSPEQAQGLAVDARSDLFAFGVMLYEMACGRRPFQGDSGLALITSILRDTPPPIGDSRPDLPERFGEIVARCLEKSPEDRYPSARQLRADLEALADEVAGAGAGRTVETRQAATAARLPVLRRSRGGLFGALAVVAVLAGVLGTQLWRGRTAGPETTAAEPAISSLAVLPLENLSGDPDQDFLVDGMTEALITDLSTIAALKVISRTSVMRYRGSDLAVPEIARALGVAALVEGSVVREGDRVRVNAKLIDAATEESIWGQSFEQDLTSVLGLQSEVARAIARKIEVALSPEEETRLSAKRSVNPKTYEAYLRGMHHLSKGTSEGFKTGIDYLNEAVDNDPADPLAYAGLALGYIRVGHDTGPSSLYFPRAVAAARRALELDPTSAKAHAALAHVKMYYDWDWSEAGPAFERAVALNPSLAEAHAHYAWFHAIFGRWDEAIEQASLAKELNPLSPVYTGWLGGIYWYAGRLEPALAETREALDMAPGLPFLWWVLGAILSSQGSHDEAIEALQKAAEMQAVWTPALAAGYGRADRIEEARNLLAELEQQDDVDPLGMAEAYAAIEDPAGAFRWLERAYEVRHRWIPWLGTSPGWRPLQADPRYQELLRRLGIIVEPPVPPGPVA